MGQEISAVTWNQTPQSLLSPLRPLKYTKAGESALSLAQHQTIWMKCLLTLCSQKFPIISKKSYLFLLVSMSQKLSLLYHITHHVTKSILLGLRQITFAVLPRKGIMFKITTPTLLCIIMLNHRCLLSPPWLNKILLISLILRDTQSITILCHFMRPHSEDRLFMLIAVVPKETLPLTN